jgi:hypothetical protein
VKIRGIANDITIATVSQRKNSGDACGEIDLSPGWVIAGAAVSKIAGYGCILCQR